MWSSRPILTSDFRDPTRGVVLGRLGIRVEGHPHHVGLIEGGSTQHRGVHSLRGRVEENRSAEQSGIANELLPTMCSIGRVLHHPTKETWAHSVSRSRSEELGSSQKCRTRYPRWVVGSKSCAGPSIGTSTPCTAGAKTCAGPRASGVTSGGRTVPTARR